MDEIRSQVRTEGERPGREREREKRETEGNRPKGRGRQDPKKEGRWINNKLLLYSTGNDIQYPVINHNKYLKRMCIYV